MFSLRALPGCGKVARTCFEAFAKLRHPHKRLRIAGAVLPDLKAVLDRFPQVNVEFLGVVSAGPPREPS